MKSYYEINPDCAEFTTINVYKSNSGTIIAYFNYPTGKTETLEITDSGNLKSSEKEICVYTAQRAVRCWVDAGLLDSGDPIVEGRFVQ
jgi:hypothetical protein